MTPCPRCQTPLEQGARFCGNCGLQLGQPAAQQPPATMDQLVGRTLNGRYQIKRKIGEGGFGAVFEALHLQMGRPVALKVLHPRLSADPQMAARFKREAQAACALSSPHTVTTHDFDQTPEGVLYMVMELIQGHSLLAELHARGAMAPHRVLRLMEQIGGALAEAHRQQIVHRDIKPENIILEQRADGAEQAKVVDFGIARIVHNAAGDTVARLTMAGQIFGTLDYMSPEQLTDGASVDHRTDIYALGALLHQMLTGAPPFSGSSSELMLAHLHQDPPAPSTSGRPGLSPALDAVVLRCLQKNPAERYQAVDQLVADLRQAIHATMQPKQGGAGASGPASSTALAATVGVAEATAGLAPPPAGSAPASHPAAPISHGAAPPPPAGSAPASHPAAPISHGAAPAPPAPATQPMGPPPRLTVPLWVWLLIIAVALVVFIVAAYAIYRASATEEAADNPLATTRRLQLNERRRNDGRSAPAATPRPRAHPQSLHSSCPSRSACVPS